MSRKSGFLRAAIRLAAIAGLSAALVRTIAPSLEQLDKSNINAMTIASALAAGLISSYVSSWLYNFRVNQIFQQYDQCRWLSYREYFSGAGVEYERAKSDAASAWHRLTREKMQAWPDFSTILQNSLEEERRIHAEQSELMRHPLSKILSHIRFRKKSSPASASS